MARKQFVVLYPDRSRENISRTERDTLLLSRAISPSNIPNQYQYIGQVRTYHSLTDLAHFTFQPTQLLRHFLEGSFTIVDTKGKRHRERLETPEAFALRLDRTGQLA